MKGTGEPCEGELHARFDEGAMEKCQGATRKYGAASCRRRQIGLNCFTLRRSNSPSPYSTGGLTVRQF